MQNQSNADDKIIHKKFVLYGANAKEWMRKCVLLLPEIDRRKIWRKKRFGSIYEYAAKIAGMSREKVNESLRILSKVEDKPGLMRVVEEKGVNAVRPVVTIVTQETSEFWAEKAKNMSVNELETYVRDFRSGGLHMEESQPVKVEIKMSLDADVANELKKCAGVDGDWNQLMKEFLVLRKKELEEQKPAKVETSSRHVPVEIQRYVMAKTGGLCAFPGCKKRAVNFHHTDRFALEKVHDPDKIVGLCEAHHAIAHRGLIDGEGSEPVEVWKVRESADWESSAKFWVDQRVMGCRER